MAVLLPDRRLGVRRRVAAAADSHGDQPASSWSALAGPWPGWGREGDDVPRGDLDGSAWLFLLDPAAWPVTRGDLVVDPDLPGEWLVTTARLIRNAAVDDVDHIRVEAHSRVNADTTP